MYNSSNHRKGKSNIIIIIIIISKKSSFQACLPQLMLGSRLHLPVAQQIQDVERYSPYCVVIRNLVLMASQLL